MGWLNDLGNGLSKAADDAAGALTDTLDSAAEAIGGTVEAAGNAVADGIDAVAKAAAGVPGIGRVLGAVLGVASRFVSGATQIAAAGARAAFNIVGNLVAGAIRIVGGGLGGLVSGNFEAAGRGIWGIGESILGGVVAILGTGVALVQGVLNLQPRERRLTEAEAALLERVYRRSVALGNVRVIEGQAGLFSPNGRPFTLGNHIYMKGFDLATAPGLSVLVHECGHVWQHQHEGTRYIGGALLAQWTLGKKAYDWKAQIDAGTLLWRDFGKEAQAQFIQDVFDGGTGAPGTPGAGAFFEDDPLGPAARFESPAGTDRTDFARASVAELRAA